MTARTATLLILMLAQPAAFGAGGTFTGRVERVIDGDTIIVRATLPSLPEVDLHRIRLADIDAPELKQPHGEEAKAALTAKILNQSVVITWQARGRYRRIIGTVYLHQENIAHTLVAQGHAHHYHRSSNQVIQILETTAKKEGRGLWSSPSPTTPQHFRHTFR